MSDVVQSRNFGIKLKLTILGDHKQRKTKIKEQGCNSAIFSLLLNSMNIFPSFRSFPLLSVCLVIFSKYQIGVLTCLISQPTFFSTGNINSFCIFQCLALGDFVLFL